MHNDKDSRQWEVLKDFNLGMTYAFPGEMSIIGYSDVEDGLILPFR